MLKTSQLKPNPAGKDRHRGHNLPSQLHGEWVDIKNSGASGLSLDGLEVHHLAYPANGGQAKWKKVIGLKGMLGVGQVLRIHSGKQVAPASLASADRLGADFHAFTGNSSFIWNNAEGDCSGLWRPSNRTWIDKASYDPYPPEGVILVRNGTKLVPQARSLGRY